ncbi:MAG: class I SAM-dependent methyltransferase [Acidobacteriota bacterium]|nr:class I SAM-dependent methyltransferase [Acidobacteriota bacterium]
MKKNTTFKKHEVEDYERKRYRGIDQKIVHAREQKILEKILRTAGKDAIRVLDLPCGYGRFSSLMLKKGFSLVSSDLSFYMVKRAEEHSRLYNLASVSGVVADAKHGLPFKQEVFNIILSMRFFHHLHEKKNRKFILKEFFYVSSKYVILSYYQMNFLHILQRKFRKKLKKSKTQIKMISRKEFQEEVEDAGFSIIKIFPLFRGIHSHHIAFLEKG